MNGIIQTAAAALCLIALGAGAPDASTVTAYELEQLPLTGAGIPVYLPADLPESREGETIQYYFAGEVQPGAYRVEIYDLANYQGGEPYPDATGLSLACRLGCLSGMREDAQVQRSPWQGDPVRIPSEAEEEAPAAICILIPGVEAQCRAGNTDVRWTQNGWSFQVIRSDALTVSRQTAEGWEKIRSVAGQGEVSIYERSIFFCWQEDGCAYVYETYNMELSAALEAFAALRCTGL